jgi:LPS-assembly lipoprotein
MRNLNLISLFCIGLLVSGCNYRPLYGTSADGKGVAVALSAVAVEEQKTRAGQIVRNNLLSNLRGGAEAGFMLRMSPEEKSQQVSALSGQKLARHRFNLKIKYELLSKQSSEVVTSGTSFSNVSYDTVEQPIADLKAAENARDRAAREVAEDIRLRLAAYFSAQN